MLSGARGPLWDDPSYDSQDDDGKMESSQAFCGGEANLRTD